MKIIPVAEQCCPVCYSKEIKVFFEARQVPVYCGLLWPSRAEAVNAPKGNILLGCCQGCSHVFNMSFRPESIQYSQPYDNSLHYSPYFQNYAKALAEGLITRYDLHGKDIIEIGSGTGDFLRLMCDLGGNRGFGFDPSAIQLEIEQPSNQQITFIQDYFSEDYSHIHADFICSRQTLEHMSDPRGFLTMLRRVIGDQAGTIVFLEVPNFLYSRPENALWDIIYEHYSYFNSHSLAHLAIQCGFDVLQVSETFDQLFLSIELTPHPHSQYEQPRILSGQVKAFKRQVEALAENHQQEMVKWQSRIQKIKDSGRRAVVWGAGARGLSFLNLLHIGEEIPYIVDINPHKWGKYIAGTGQAIVEPDFLRKYLPEIVIIVNPIYKREIAEMVASFALQVEFLYA